MSSTFSQEEDIAQPASWPSEEHTALNKGRGNESAENQNLRTSKSPDAFSSYPPINDDAEESRRVEENLRRWEIAERQRRKAARESSAVSDVSRRATLLWQGRKSKVPPIGGLGAHAALQSQDNIDILPLRGPTPSTSRSNSEDGDYSADPFANPPDTLSPFSDAHHPDQPEAIPVRYENEPPVSVHINPPKVSHHLPPKPLSLPPPRTPPPIASLTPIFQSNSTYENINEHIPQDAKWWHEWLCGYGEGPNRGGDNQAGRTNPFE